MSVSRTELEQILQDGKDGSHDKSFWDEDGWLRRLFDHRLPSGRHAQEWSTKRAIGKRREATDNSSKRLRLARIESASLGGPNQRGKLAIRAPALPTSLSKMTKGAFQGSLGQVKPSAMKSSPLRMLGLVTFREIGYTFARISRIFECFGT